MRRKKAVAAILIFAIGIITMAYPSLHDRLSQRSADEALRELRSRLEDTDIAVQKRLAQDYNERLLKCGGGTEEEYNQILNISDGIMGSIRIPAIEVELPIFHGVSEEVLAKGVGHMPQSAFPVGGEGNHTVLTGHTGLPGAVLFTDLIQLREGDMFYLFVLGETLAYRVDQIRVVLPDEGKELEPVPGKDCCTLVTCTPYGINSHRLLVRGVREESHN